EEKLKTSEASYRFLAENTLDLIIHMDANLKILYISPNCDEFLGYSPREFKTEFFPYLIIHPEYQEMMKEQYLGMQHKLQPNLVCYEAVRKDGSKFWVESLSNPIIDQTTSMFAGSLTVIRNIEDRVKYEEQLFENTKQKEILLREIHHRVKNNFALLFSILTLQRYSTNNSEMKDLIEELQLRIRAMSSIHDLLYRNDDLADIPFDIYSVQLVNIVIAAFRNKPIHIHYNMDTCILDIKIALPLGLIVNELVTNSFKYAFSENGEGILSIGLHLHEPATEKSPEIWKLTVRDNGKGLPEEYATKTSHTLGTQIIKMLVSQIEGEITARSDEGACFDIIFPQQID
ncbi:MAG TPA: histidine kinase dimerization/phosphoacceptor domain -containing protein, partial [Bacteroidales bacterium]|nr:histidine kinase dimerization/phosphoacceptor domain -containing protein [Bacteroidales bacterium]